MFFLKKMLLKFFDKVDRKIDDLLFERSFWIVVHRMDLDYDDIVDSIREMIAIARSEGDETAFVKTARGEYYTITGYRDTIIIPHSVIKDPEIEVHTHIVKGHPPRSGKCSLSGCDFLKLHSCIDTIEKEVLVVVGEAHELFKVYSLKKDKREELRKNLESILSDEDKYLSYRFKAVGDDELQRFFDITVYHDVEEMVKNVFPIVKPKKFEEAIQYIKSHYDPRLLDELAEEIRKAIKNAIKKGV